MRKSLALSKSASLLLSALIAVTEAMIVMPLLTVDLRIRLNRVVSSEGVYMMCYEARIIIL